MDNNQRVKLDFLYDAIHDTQKWIRFMDSKAGALAVFITSISVILANQIIINFSTITNCLYGYRGIKFTQFLLIFLAIGLQITILFLIFLVINPQTNPVKYVKVRKENTLGLYFLSSLDKAGKIQISHEEYIEKLNNASQQDVINELVFELMKLSYIRISKEKLMNIITWMIFIDIILLSMSYAVLKISSCI